MWSAGCILGEMATGTIPGCLQNSLLCDALCPWVFGEFSRQFNPGILELEFARCKPEGAALFHGDSEIDTIFQIFRKLGTPTEAAVGTSCKSLDVLQSATCSRGDLPLRDRCLPVSFTNLSEADWPGLSDLPDFKPSFPQLLGST